LFVSYKPNDKISTRSFTFRTYLLISLINFEKLRIFVRFTALFSRTIRVVVTDHKKRTIYAARNSIAASSWTEQNRKLFGFSVRSYDTEPGGRVPRRPYPPTTAVRVSRAVVDDGEESRWRGRRWRGCGGYNNKTDPGDQPVELACARARRPLQYVPTRVNIFVPPLPRALSDAAVGVRAH
jgi:hypothetical protein